VIPSWTVDLLQSGALLALGLVVGHIYTIVRRLSDAERAFVSLISELERRLRALEDRR
jgi:hypothetical protein